MKYDRIHSLQRAEINDLASKFSLFFAPRKNGFENKISVFEILKAMLLTSHRTSHYEIYYIEVRLTKQFYRVNVLLVARN